MTDVCLRCHLPFSDTRRQDGGTSELRFYHGQPSRGPFHARCSEEELGEDSEIARLRAENERLKLQNVNLRHAISWACGEAPDGNDQWFGDVQPEVKPGERPRPYWWRSHLRKVAGLDAEQKVKEG